MKHPALVIIKPDGINKGLIGNIFTKFAETKLDIIGIRIVKATRKLAEEHYKNLKGERFFKEIVLYLSGALHKNKKIVIIVYHGKDAIKKCRRVAGATNPEEAAPNTIRGSYGRITTKGIFENVVHVSSDKEEAKREIKLWFDPDDLLVDLYSTKTQTEKLKKRRVWA